MRGAGGERKEGSEDESHSDITVCPRFSVNHLPLVYLQYTSVYLQYTLVYLQYTSSIPPVYLQYTSSIPTVYHLKVILSTNWKGRVSSSFQNGFELQAVVVLFVASPNTTST